mgnify:CR=1 FL=1
MCRCYPGCANTGSPAAGRTFAVAVSGSSSSSISSSYSFNSMQQRQRTVLLWRLPRNPLRPRPSPTFFLLGLAFALPGLAFPFLGFLILRAHSKR